MKFTPQINQPYLNANVVNKIDNVSYILLLVFITFILKLFCLSSMCSLVLSNTYFGIFRLALSYTFVIKFAISSQTKLFVFMFVCLTDERH